MHNRILNAIRKMTPEKRRDELSALLTQFPDDWLEEALHIAQQVKARRNVSLSELVGEWLKIRV